VVVHQNILGKGVRRSWGRENTITAGVWTPVADPDRGSKRGKVRTREKRGRPQSEKGKVNKPSKKKNHKLAKKPEGKGKRGESRPGKEGKKENKAWKWN